MNAPPLGPVTPGASWEPPGKKPLKCLSCSLHSYSTSHVSGFSCELTNPLLLDGKVFPQRIYPDLGLSWSSCWTCKVFPQRISLDLSFCWYRLNRQYVQGSGKLVLKLPGFRATAPPNLHPSMVMEPSLPEEGVWQHQPQRHILKRRKAMADGAGCSWGSRTPAPPASPPSLWACSFHLLGACQ